MVLAFSKALFTILCLSLDTRTSFPSSVFAAWKMMGALSTDAEASESNEGTTSSFWRPVITRQTAFGLGEVKRMKRLILLCRTSV